MNKKLLIAIIVIVVIAVGGYFLLKQKSTNDKIHANEPSEIVIGYNCDMSGGTIAPFGVSGMQGFQIAVDEINAKGGILGKKIRPVILDDKADKEISKKNMEQLIFQDKAVAVIGPANSTNALYWLELAQENEIIVIVPIATASEITTKYSERPRNYIFGIRNLDKVQSSTLIAWAIQKTNNGKIAVIYEPTPFGLQGEKDATEVLARWGKIPVLTKSFDKNASIEDLAKIIKAAKEAKADGIYFFSYPEYTAKLLKAVKQVKDYNPVMFGPAANSANELWDTAGNLAQDFVFISSFNSDRDQKTKELNAKVIKKYGNPPAKFSATAIAYDSVYLIKASIEKSGSTDKVAVRDALETIEKYDGVYKFYDNPFDKMNHDALNSKDFYLAKWVDGTVVDIKDDISKLEIR